MIKRERMKEIFKELIQEFHELELPAITKRHLVLPIFPEHVRKAFVLIGMRRSGKTWTLYQIMQDLLNAGLESSKILYINFEDERLAEMETKDFQSLLEAYFELYPAYLHRSDIYFFFDEIHEIALWEKFIRRLLDQEKMHIYLTGSSAKLLSKEIASALRGRTIAQEIFPFNFSEYLSKLDVQIPHQFSTASKIRFRHHIRNFLQWGGFPETIGASPQAHRLLLQGYTSSVIYRDIIERYDVTNVHALKQLLSHALRNSAALFSINKLHKTFKSMGIEVGKATLYEYMDYFDDAYCVFSIEKFDLSQRVAATSVKKIYAVDQGLITAFSVASEFDYGAQLETALFAFLRRLTHEIYYYKTSDNKEVDFFIKLPDQSKHLFQACLSLKDTKTRKREIDALKSAMEELKIKKGTIVTLEDEEEKISVPTGIITVKPVWKMFLSNEL